MANFKTNPAIIFTPGNKPERFSKAADMGANGIIIDLEDGVADKDKDLARNNVIHYLSSKVDKTIVTIIRINHMATQAGLKDLLALTNNRVHFDAVLCPKVESAQEINLIAKLLATTYDNIALIALIETAKGLSQVDHIVEQSHSSLKALMFGAADYVADVGCACNISALSMARMKIIQAAALKNLARYDSPYFDFANESGLLDELNYIKTLGFTGKAAIHPKQVSQIKAAFKPTPDEYQQAQQMIKIYDEAKGKACQYQGKMIDVPVYNKAKQIVEMYNNLK